MDKTYKAIMLDLETLGDNFITQIGAVAFEIDLEAEKWVKIDEFNYPICGDSMEALGGKMNYVNVKFWIDNAKNATWLTERCAGIDWALDDLESFIKKHKCDVWSHAYDYKVLRDTYKLIREKDPYKKEPKWMFHNWMHLSVVTRLAGLEKIKRPKTLLAHDAVDDCLFQIEYFTKAYIKLVKNKEDK